MNQRNVRLLWIVLTVIFYIPGIVAIVNQNATDAAK